MKVPFFLIADSGFVVSFRIGFWITIAVILGAIIYINRPIRRRRRH